MVDREAQELVNLRVLLSVSARILPDPAGSAGGRKVEFTIVDANGFIRIQVAFNFFMCRNGTTCSDPLQTSSVSPL